MKITFNNKLDPDEQISCEEDIAFILFEESVLDEDECQRLSTKVLAVVLSRFRKDLVLVTED